MKVKAMNSFSGNVSMAKGEVREITDKEVLSDLIQAKHVEEVKAKRGVKSNESK